MSAYNKTLLNELKFKFNNSEFIDKNFSQAYQDMFVLTMLNGKKNGTFVEIGAYNGQQISNTYLLEKKFDWTGISIDINDISKSFLKHERTSQLVIQDALKINYEQLFLQILNKPAKNHGNSVSNSDEALQQYNKNKQLVKSFLMKNKSSLIKDIDLNIIQYFEPDNTMS